MKKTHISFFKSGALVPLITSILIVMLAITSPSCGKKQTRKSKSKSKSKSSTATKKSENKTRPGLKVIGEWSVDNKTHQEPMVVPGVNTKNSDTLFVAFIASDSGQGPESGGPPLDGSILEVSGGGLEWKRQVNAHLSTTKEPGIAEIWTAYSPAPLQPFKVEVKRDNKNGANTYCDNYQGGSGPDIANGMVFLQAIVGADSSAPIGATGAVGSGPKSGLPGPPSVNLTTTHTNSWVEGVGSDWTNPISRSLSADQEILHESEDMPNGDAYWVQRLKGVVASPQAVNLGIQAPTEDDCNLVVVEIIAAP